MVCNKLTVVLCPFTAENKSRPQNKTLFSILILFVVLSNREKLINLNFGKKKIVCKESRHSMWHYLPLKTRRHGGCSSELNSNESVYWLSFVGVQPSLLVCMSS